MHGLGDSAQGFLPVFADPRANPVTLDTKVVLLTAPSKPVTINGGMIMPSWYDILSITPPGPTQPMEKSISIPQLNDSYKRITNVVTEELKNLKGKLFIGGFSQGAVMALYVGMENVNVKGIFAFSGALQPQAKLTNLGKIPIHIFHGAVDDVVPWNMAKKSYERIANDKKVTISVDKNLGHSVNMEQLLQFKKVFADATK